MECTVKAPPTGIRLHLKARLFLFPSSCIWWKRLLKTELFKNAFPCGTFWKRCFRVYVWTDKDETCQKSWRHTIYSNSLSGLTIANTYASSKRSRVIVWKLSFSNRFIVNVWTGQNNAKSLLVDPNFFENGEKKVASSNEYGYVKTGPKLCTIERE